MPILINFKTFSQMMCFFLFYLDDWLLIFFYFSNTDLPIQLKVEKTGAQEKKYICP